MGHGRIPQRLSALVAQARSLGDLKPEQEFTPFGMIEDSAPGTAPGLESGGLTGLGTNDLLAQILAVLTGTTQRDERYPVSGGLSSTHDHQIGKILLTTALTQSRVAVGKRAYRITFLKVPKGLCKFEIRTRDSDQEPFDVLASGNICEFSNPVTEFFVTTEPAIDAGTVKWVAGEVKFHQGAPVRDPFVQVYTQDEQSNYTANRVIDDTIGCRSTDNTKLVTSTVPVDYFSGIPKNWSYRLYGSIQALKPSSTSVGRVFLRVMKDGTGTVLRRFGEMLIPESGALQVYYDTGFRRYSEKTKLQIDFNDLGVAGNQVLVETNLELEEP